MSLLNIILTVLLVLGGVPSAIWGSLRLKSWYEDTKERQHFFLRSIIQALQELSGRALEFRSLEMHIVRVAISGPPVDRVDYTQPSLFLDEQAENAKVGNAIRRKLRELKKLKHRYTTWLDEAQYIADSTLSRGIENRKKLKDNWAFLVKGPLDLANEIKGIAYPKLFEGTLNLGYVKEALVRKYGPDFAVTIMENTHEVQIRLRQDFLETRDFYILLEELIKVESRPSIKELRVAQRKLLLELEATQEAIFKRDKQVLHEFRAGRNESV